MMKKNLLLFFGILSFTLASQEQKPIIFSIVPAFPPLMFVDDEGEPDGFIVELFSQILDDLEISYDIQPKEFSHIYGGLLSGEIDLFLPMIYSEEREELFYFSSSPILSSWGELFVSDSTVFNDISELVGTKIGIMKDDINGSNFETFMENLNIPFSKVIYPSYEELFSAVERGEVFGAVCSNQIMRKQWKIQPTGTIFYPSPGYPVTGREKGNIELIDRITEHITQLKADHNSYYYTLMDKWFYAEQTQNGLTTREWRVIIMILSLFFLIIGILFFNNRFLHREVKRRVSEIEGQREEKKKVEVRNEFLSSISHELRTPMNIIVSLAYLLSQTKLDRNQQDKILKITKASQLLINIINNFLDFNRLERGAINLEIIPFSPEKEAREILSMFKEDAENKGLKLVSDFQDPLPPVLWGDPFRITQVLNNLINNAIKFSPKGNITLSLHTKELNEGGYKIIYSVRDEGIGIDQESIESLFLPFTQADDSISRQFGGSGLGLTICLQLVKLMGGTLEVKSHKGRGTTFTTAMECKKGQKEDLSEQEKNYTLESFPGAKVLFVEDNLINREIGKELLGIANLTLNTATNGQEAFDLIKKNEYDLVLMDIQMPVLDGFSASVAIRKWEIENKRKRVPIVALTAQSRDDESRKDFFVAMDGYVTKPISIDRLNRVFLEWLGDFREKGNHLTKIVNGDVDGIPGIDLDKALTFVGNRALLTSCLETFIEDYKDTPKRFLTLEKERDYETLKTQIHALKGTLGYLGFFLFTDIISLEESLLSKKEDFGEKLKGFSQELDRVIKGLEELHNGQ